MAPALSCPSNRPTAYAPGLLAGIVLGLMVSAAPAHAADGSPPATTAQSIDELFGGAPPAPKKPATTAPAVPGTPAPTDTQPEPGGPTLSGFYQNDLAYTYAGDEHW